MIHTQSHQQTPGPVKIAFAKTNRVAALCLIFLAVSTSAAMAEEPETVASFLVMTRIQLEANIASGARGEFIRKGFVDAGLAEIDAEKVVNAWAHETAGCVVARMQKQLAGIDTDEEAKRVELLKRLLKNQKALHVETQRCMNQTPVNSDESVLGPGWFPRAMQEKETR